MNRRETTFVVGGQGYIGSAVTAIAADAVTVSRDGSAGTLPWQDFLALLPGEFEPSVVWLLDGAKHDESARLTELITALPARAHVAYVSTCTVYGNVGGDVCTERTPLSLITPHARIKAAGEDALGAAGVATAVLRFGALYGPDPRGLRKDRVTTWLNEASDQAQITVPHPTHWRGWLHRDQAGRALYAAAAERHLGTFNVSSSDATFTSAVRPAAELFGAAVVPGAGDDPLDYRIDSTPARVAGILTELPGEDLAGCIRAEAERRWPELFRMPGATA
ncbi:NAD-dependent epimerase/dehydratase family protein [Promicromonospora sp. NPDC057138]|uniref:NAD-dependent epimerase/dehydratase family protein n=1 Tax=Promicromonospora sp. NPDC057138 TaxID=3346031 RepID=UPI00362E1395